MGWQDELASFQKHADELCSTFALSVTALDRLRSELSGTDESPFICDDKDAGFLLWETTVVEARSSIHVAKWFFVTMTLADWKALLESFLRSFVAEQLRRNGTPNIDKITRRIMKDSRNWRSEIQHELGLDIGANCSITWVAIREWIAIRNHLVHNGRFVTQRFFDSLADIPGHVTYPYVIGQEFSINPGEVFRLLVSTRSLIDELATGLP